MFKRLLFTFHILLFTLLCATAQSDDPVVMTVGGVPVTRSEFEYNYNKNNNEGVIDKKSVDEYVDLFAVYKMKVLAAMDAKMDTAQSFIKEFHQYRDQQIRPMLVPESAVDAECHTYYDNILKSLDGKDLIMPAHIFLHLKQTATKEEQDAAKNSIDSIYQAFQAGAKFEDLAREYSDDQQTATRGGALPWIGPGNTLKEFEDVAYSLEVGQVSEPFLSTVGYHIVKLLDRKPLEPYDTLYPQIHKFLEARGVRDRLAQQQLDSAVVKYGEGVTVEDILDKETERLCAQDQDLKYLVQEYHDGLLMFDLCSQKIWEPAKVDTVGLQKYFSSHKKKYSWKEPHFSGMLYYCKNASDVATVKKILKKVPEEKWITTIRSQFNKDSVTVRMDKRLFQKGDNPSVDALAFKLKGAKVKKNDKFPYEDVVGKVLKKGPAKWTDISAQVIQDYQKEREDAYVAELRKKYPVTVNQNVLKTINKDNK